MLDFSNLTIHIGNKVQLQHKLYIFAIKQWIGSSYMFNFVMLVLSTLCNIRNGVIINGNS